MKKLIAITGSDGCGKSTVIEALSNQFPSSVVSDIWQPMYRENTLFNSKHSVDNYLCELLPEARSLFLAHAILESVQKQETNASDIHFINAYYYKYFATELAYGVSSEKLQDLIAWFPKPDLTIRLTVPLEVVAQRKKRFSRYESGGVIAPTVTDFVAFQQKSIQQWDKFKNEKFVEISNEGPVEETLQLIYQAINRL